MQNAEKNCLPWNFINVAVAANNGVHMFSFPCKTPPVRFWSWRGLRPMSAERCWLYRTMWWKPTTSTTTRLRRRSQTRHCWQRTVKSCVTTWTSTGWLRPAMLIPKNVSVIIVTRVKGTFILSIHMMNKYKMLQVAVITTGVIPVSSWASCLLT